MSVGREALEHLQTILLAVLFALGVRAFLIEPYSIPSGSMLPTLLVGDHLFVNKFVYGIRVPFTDVRLPGLREPARGDVVVFDVARDGREIQPADRRPDLPRERFVKRIVGLPGDRIEVDGAELRVNGIPVPRRPTGESFDDGIGRPLVVLEEELDGHSHLALDDPEHAGAGGRFEVEPGRYFMMGDNRDDSHDSRTWGSVRFEEFKGPAFALYWSWDWNGSWASLLDPRTWWDLLGSRMRWSRVGDAIR
jgi:signal peptidase I